KVANHLLGPLNDVATIRLEDPLMQKIRYLDKLIDELAKGKAMESSHLTINLCTRN
ncbi:DUF2200 family protein, partial [Enterococcus faecium]|uniref:DUF2200 family protein n=1 Tax=Enterococcus faecium TaxID=1352 RepID=UPI003D2168F1